MKDLFGYDEVVIKRQSKTRDTLGRYATKERAYADKAKRDAEYWRFMAEKYRRMYQSVAHLIAIKDRIINKMKGE